MKGESPAMSTFPSRSPSPELQYIEPGHLPAATTLELEKDQEGDIPYIRLPSFSPTFPNNILINEECHNSNSKDGRWAKLTALADTSLTAADTAQKATQCNKAQKQAALHNLINKVTCEAKEIAPINVPICQVPD